MAVSSRKNRRVTQVDPPLERVAPVAPVDAKQVEPADTKQPRVAKKRIQTRANNENDARLLADRPPHWG
ncbi:hypothetical protein QBL02_09745 [Leucobacter sp. UT-8R-CII-1-4]|uniref:hypothetical protein n=1 Tax=Leucobacter sp. UT-8R-CII-1-4 TaxID=3040075 RepID=UPI0024A9CB62|nr:hypothetical protein [Leucobacter sp. UT-8R-CII-1-4]MDI6023825.1 hypothetical protein [Leucobacter sp. UT-8R-CII-1-4]